jgi:hypothetical protein
MVANGLYKGLQADDRKRLKVHYYVAKDQVEPMHKVFKARSCHSKFTFSPRVYCRFSETRIPISMHWRHRKTVSGGTRMEGKWKVQLGRIRGGSVG